MGIKPITGNHEILLEAVRLLNTPIHLLRVAEFGNQRVYYPEFALGRLTPLKGIFMLLGAEHESFDINGKDGANGVDLGKPLEMPGWRGYFDLVTNFGTTEHVADGQKHAFANVHYLCRAGGIMCHVVPHANDCVHNCTWHYTMRWFSELAKFNGYEVVRLDTADLHKYDSQKIPGAEIVVRAIFRKGYDQQFNFDAWQKPRETNRRVRARRRHELQQVCL